MIIAQQRSKLISLLVASVVVLGAIVFSWLSPQPITNAADMSKFEAGNIMSDSVMSNRNSMTVQQIQAFLDSKNACNNTDIHKAAWYPTVSYSIKDGKFVCMAKESFNGESAAQIIWQAGQDYNINPQVLIVLLEKEQGLITDTWPNSRQYQTATGYGCPDTAPCDAQYYGLKNQLRQAANLFRTVLNGGWSNYPVGNVYIQYNPSASCGGSVVNIKNRATSALYRYTPYQPNEATKNVNIGVTAPCGAYGNKNFWWLFTDWFGSTQDQYFVSMDSPRQLYTTEDTIKIDPATGIKTEDIPAGLIINFQQKAIYNRQVCLRTATDTSLDKRMCVLESNLSEMFSGMTTPRKLISKEDTIKIDPATGIKTEDIPAGLEINFAQLNNIPGNGLCLRTATDQQLNKQMCILYGNLLETSQVFSNMDAPRPLKVTNDTSKINPVTSNPVPNQIVANGQTVEFSSKSTTKDGQLCLRTHSNTKTDNNMCILYSNLQELSSGGTSDDSNIYVNMDVPRKLKTIRDTTKIDAKTGDRYDPLPKNLVIEFTMRTEVNGKLCLRTKTDASLNKNSCVFYDDLDEI